MLLRALLIQGLFIPNFLPFFSRIFYYFQIFVFFSPNIGMLSVPDILPSVNFSKFGYISCFFLIFLFYWKPNLEKKVVRRPAQSIAYAIVDRT